MNVNGDPVPGGSEIMAYYEGELIAESTVEEEGRYNLNLNLVPENYTNIENMELYINGDKASFEIPASRMETIQNTASGSIIEVNINSSVSSTDSETGSGGSSNPAVEAMVVNKDTGESKSSDKTGGRSEASLAGKDEDDIANAEGPVSQADYEGKEDIEGVEGVEDREGIEGREDREGAEDAEGAESAENTGYSTVFTVLLFVAAFFGAFMVIKR